ncbi:MAG TPA: carboxylate-amine ligase [Acidimicrobiales bacterium]
MDGTTLGVEEEFQIIDRATGELVPRSDELVPAARRSLGDRVTAELNRCQVETATPVCADLGEVRAELVRLRSELDRVAEAIGCGILPLATHPWSSWQDQQVEDDRARFREMEDRYQRVARQQVICGCHIHVGIEDPDRVVEVMTRVRPWIPVLLALAANSPYWNGEDTGYDSYRLEIWERWPTAGLPPALADRAAYDEVVDELREADAIEDATHLYWYLRPSDRYPTLEFRATDVCLDVDAAVCLAGLARALVRTCVADAHAGVPVGTASSSLLGASLWRAARYGLAEDLVSPSSAAPLPAADVVRELLARVGGALDQAGDREEVTALAEAILRDGNGARRQREALAQRGDPADVVALGRAGLLTPAD